MTEARGRVRAETGNKRVRAFLGGQVVAETSRPLLVWEAPNYPTYYFPAEDVSGELTPTGETQRAPSRGVADVFDLTVGDTVAKAAASTYAEPEIDALRGHVRLDWASMDAWFEEDEQVYFHPRNPYTRIDALRSTRHVVVELDGQVLADSRAPVVLYETNHVPRFYLPATDVRRDLLTVSDRVTNCPYKGTTVYFHARLGGREVPNVAWSYPSPFAESLPIAGMVCFAGEGITTTVDGAVQ